MANFFRKLSNGGLLSTLRNGTAEPNLNETGEHDDSMNLHARGFIMLNQNSQQNAHRSLMQRDNLFDAGYIIVENFYYKHSCFQETLLVLCLLLVFVKKISSLSPMKVK